jgi:dynamin 1-like protein
MEAAVRSLMNLSQTEKKKNAEEWIEKQLEKEEEFLEAYFPEIADKNGIPFLEKSLSNLLMRHIQKCLPGLKEQVSKKMNENEKILAACGDEVQDKNRTLSKILSNFIEDFRSIIDGSYIDLDTDSEALIGGPAIRKVFDEKFSQEMKEIKLNVSTEKIVSNLKKVGGPRPAIFAPENLFERIVKKEIERLRNPSLKCAENIHKQMDKVINFCIKEQVELKRFPKLMEKISMVMKSLLDERKPAMCQLIKVMLEVELSCINTNHPDFSIQEVLKEYENKENHQVCTENDALM